MSINVVQAEIHDTRAGNGGGQNETTYSRCDDFDGDDHDHK